MGDVNMEIILGAKVVPLEECAEWQKAKDLGQQYLLVIAVRHMPSGDLYAVTANEKRRIGVTVSWLTEEQLALYEDEEMKNLLEHCSRLWLKMRIDKALDERDKEAFKGLTEELKKAKG